MVSARLVGRNGSSVDIVFHPWDRTDDAFQSFLVDTRLCSDADPRFVIDACSEWYSVPSVENLDLLLAGDQGAEFVFENEGFHLSIRFGDSSHFLDNYIVKVIAASPCLHTKWPTSRRNASALVRSHGAISLVALEFECSVEPVVMFARQIRSAVFELGRT